ncbi:MAG: hypothetical protein A4E73_02641 [Syntrophaceae bacterium PtaU1.Bin231]|nr:MAG: hypothetical protein A4E73_02641 [Syntrophaceae bacterium PtaU1.Bin231]
MIEQETCLFHRDVSSGDQYVETLHTTVERAMAEKTAMPIVRFADGEYAFYRHSLDCNGLYRQAEDAAAIRRVMPGHLEAMRTLARRGRIAPLVFPGNTRKKARGLFSFLRKSHDDSALGFLAFLAANGIELTGDNYVPFYAVYAYLASGRFASLLDGKSVCVVNSDFDEGACRSWFRQFSSRPRISHAPIAAEYVATRWDSMREGVLAAVPPGVDVCIVGAGVGALQVCVDIADRFSAIAVDAGHVMNMMNGRVDKSGGPRLYTLWKDTRA